jgi:uncharacterized protein
MVDSKRYIDVNIFVYWIGDHQKFGEMATQWITKIENSPRGEYVTSSLSIYETLVIMGGMTGKTMKDKSFVEEVVNALTHIKGLAIEPLKPEDFIEAKNQMNDCKLDYEDALHLAVATRTGAQEIVSNDKDFDGTPIKRII